MLIALGILRDEEGDVAFASLGATVHYQGGVVVAR
jgi:hypothetical protein